MNFHLTTGASDKHRAGTFNSEADAMASGMLRVATGQDSPAFIVKGSGFSGGRLVAGFDDELGWVSIDPDEQIPAWWTALPHPSRVALLGDPEKALSAEEVAMITKHGGSAISTYWISVSPSGAPFRLPQSAQDWIVRYRLSERYAKASP